MGWGSGKDNGKILSYIIENYEGILIIDADGINALSKLDKNILSKSSCSKIILTPHPLEFSRLSGIPTVEVQSNRLATGKEFAKEHNCILVLKGAGTIVTDGKETYINSSGSSALAKAGSGDVLAGHLAALIASGISPLEASALAVYLHGLAADALAEELSDFGVIPSDLSRELARQIRQLEQSRKNKNVVTLLP
jgi:NAD(P)H-hydrate epimerase